MSQRPVGFSLGLVASGSLAAPNRKPCAIRCDSEWRQYYAQHGR